MPRFEVFGRYEVEVERRGGRWRVYRLGRGKRREDPTLFIPGDVPEPELAGWLEDLLHEEGRPGASVSRID